MVFLPPTPYPLHPSPFPELAAGTDLPATFAARHPLPLPPGSRHRWPGICRRWQRIRTQLPLALQAPVAAPVRQRKICTTITNGSGLTTAFIGPSSALPEVAGGASLPLLPPRSEMSRVDHFILPIFRKLSEKQEEIFTEVWYYNEIVG
jgi:hypothetical protein